NMLYLSKGDIGRSGHHGIEIASGFPIDKVSKPVSLPGFHKSKFGAQRQLQYILFSIPTAGFFAISDDCAKACRSIKTPYASSPGPNALSESALRDQFKLHFPTQHQFFKESVFPNISGDHLLDLTLLEENPNPKIINTGIVADNRKIFGSL